MTNTCIAQGPYKRHAARRLASEQICLGLDTERLLMPQIAKYASKRLLLWLFASFIIQQIDVWLCFFDYYSFSIESYCFCPKVAINITFLYKSVCNYTKIYTRLQIYRPCFLYFTCNFNFKWKLQHCYLKTFYFNLQ